MKQIIIGVLVVIAIIGGAVVFGKDDETTAGAISNNIYGNESSQVVLTEYGDFQCGACAAFYPLVSQIKEEYIDSIRFEYRHFPLVQIHPNATAAHRASEAAAKQGKFWEMHDILFERQQAWSGAASTADAARIFEGYAAELELDLEQYQADVAAGDTLATINADIALGKEAGATGTPTFVLNGQRIDDTTTIDTIDEFRAVLDEALGVNATTDETPTETTEDTTAEPASTEAATEEEL